MNLAVDVRILHAPHAGSAYYTRGILRALPKAGFQGRVLLIGPAPTAPMLGNGLATEDVVVDGIGLCDERWEQLDLPPLLAQLKPDVFVSSTTTLPMLRSCPQVNIVYDLGFERHPEFYAQALRGYLRKWVRPSCRVADVVVALSEFGRDEIIETYGLSEDRIVICPGAAEERFKPVKRVDQLRSIREKYGISGGCVLSVCSLEKNKNLPRLLQAFAQALDSIEDTWKLMLVGRPGGAAGQLAQLIEELGLAGSVVTTGFVPDEDLPALYSAADLFAFVSLYEGFGLPPLEAMACGTPVLASTAASLPEVVGDAGVLLEPDDVGQIAERLSYLTNDPGARRGLAERGLGRAKEFSWTRSAQRLLEACERALCAF
jgi:glycosyltransferase involved in cell wall biosynthesis